MWYWDTDENKSLWYVKYENFYSKRINVGNM